MESEVADMTGFFGTPYASTEVPKQSITDVDTMPSMQATGMVGGNTLDEIIMQNNKEMERRRSVQEQLFVTDAAEQVEGLRRGSMIEFGSAGAGELNGFHFGSSTAQGRDTGTLREAATASREPRRRSMGTIDLSSHYAGLGVDFRAMTPSASFRSRLHIPNLMNLSVPRPYIAASSASAPSNAMLMDFESESASHGADDLTPMNMFAQRSLHHSPQDALTSPMHQSFGAQNGQDGDRRDGSLGSASGLLGELNNQDTLNDVTSISMANQPQDLQSTIPLADMSAQESGSAAPIQNTLPSIHEPMEGRAENTLVPAMGNPSFSQADGLQSVYGQQQQRPLRGPAHPPRLSFDGVYSSSGFDMMAVLMKVATRPNPQINIGAVDMSCAFVVSDATKHDLPIIYCSEMFERLTGYTRHEILGRNCRFLQAPDGKVQGGVPRKYVDDDTVYYLKNKIEAYQEAQTSLINYRKGGQPFMNLLTMIPITWDTNEIKFIVGFQVDLVEQPNSVSNKNPNGSYLINYQRDYLPRYVLPDLPRHEQVSEPGYTVNRDEVSTVLTAISAGESELSKQIWDKVLLENTDDVVHVLSLKGLFLYLSPSCRKVLEYDSQELVGTALSSICHPSDIVPVTRELKDTTSGSVSIVFRIRRKHSGYTWFEGHGSLHTEQGKGRKYIIMVGRERPVYALSKKDVLADGGIGENELWTKMSTSGMFLFVSYTSKILLDKLPDDLVGTSIQALMRPDSRIELSRALELARTGKRAQFKHELINKRGQVLQAQTTVYPGDASEGQKPTFFVAQTRMLKSTRAVPVSASAKAALKLHQQASGGSTTSGMSGSSPSRFSTQPTSFPASSAYPPPPEMAATVAGNNGLPIGSQDIALASEENVFDELKTTRSTSWQFELRQMEKRNRLLVEELQSLLQSKKKRKRGRGAAQMQKDCANCHTKVTPEWRRGPSGKRDLCNSCGLRWAKQNGRVSPRTSSDRSDMSPTQPSPRARNGTTHQQQSPAMPPPTDKRTSGEANARLLQTSKNLPSKRAPESPVSPRRGDPETVRAEQQPPQDDSSGGDEIT